jgi:hypothetical protein
MKISSRKIIAIVVLIFCCVMLCFQTATLAGVRLDGSDGLDRNRFPKVASGGMSSGSLPAKQTPSSEKEKELKEHNSNMEKISRDNAAGEQYEKDKREGKAHA